MMKLNKLCIREIQSGQSFTYIKFNTNLLHSVFLLINSPTFVGLSCQPSQGAHKFLTYAAYASTYMVEILHI